MFVKQIEIQEALRLAGNGKEVQILAPSTQEPEKWTDYEPDTLQNLLSDCLFFRTEPAMKASEFGDAPQESGKNPSPDTEGTAAGTAASGRKSSAGRMGAGKKRKAIDTGKLMALHKAGWSNVKIADELEISDVTVGKYLKQMEGEDGNKGKHQNDTGVGE